ncbi:MAG: glycoside hydrolase family 2 [Lachnospiraceae bacterium]|nr:glycoside hydrolase family 2 [Lachnospiraceae bacterium]
MGSKFNELTMDAAVDRRPMGRYPRPSMVRDSYMCLNGKWDDGVTVPFPLESRLSGFKHKFRGEYTYHRTICIDKDFVKSRILLHFGAVDAIADVYIDDSLVCHHEGGYLPFTIDITDYIHIDKVQTLTVEVRDHLSHLYPYGKQKKKRGGMWYTPVSGIWQTVWIESVPEKYIKSVEITPFLDKVTFDVETEEETIGVEIYDGDMLVYKGKSDNPYFSVPIKNPVLWTPDNPHLYDVIITAGRDEVKSYFGLRTVSIEEVKGVPRILLNGKPFFFHGVLDQGYFPEGIYTPNNEDVYREDILRLKALGINTIRKHIKIEPEAFYEACDRLGMLVFQDMVNNGRYSFLRDTAMPTLGHKSIDDTKRRVKDEVKATFEQHMEETLAHLYNFPCIVYYTIFNEGWGQFDSDIMYDIVKAMDSSRIIDSTSGWFWQEYSDVDSLHIYFKDVQVERSDRPIILSEFGGYSYKIPEHSFNLKKNYGYGKATSHEELTDMIEKLYEEQILPAIDKGLCGSIYTQATDVEDETNGFYTYDRKVCKVDADRMRKLADKLAKRITDGT